MFYYVSTKKINVIWSNSLCVAAQLNFHSLGISLPVKILEKNYGQLLLYGSHTIDGGGGEGGRRFKRVHINPPRAKDCTLSKKC